MSEILAVDQGAASSSQRHPTVLELEDLLYDIVASGADPSLPAGTFEAVQAFLHQHARSKHSLAEFLEFFAAHGLSTVKETTLTFALPPPLELRAPASMSAPAPLAAPVAATPSREPDPIEVAPVRARAAQRSTSKTMAVFGAVALAALSCGAYLGIALSRTELERVRAEQRATAESLARVQAESETLRQSMERNAALVQRLDQKSELLLQTLVSPLDPAQR